MNNEIDKAALDRHIEGVNDSYFDDPPIASQIETGDLFKTTSMKEAKIAGTIIREEDEDISESTRKAVKDSILVVVDGRSKEIIPLDEELEEYTPKSVLALEAQAEKDYGRDFGDEHQERHGS